MRTIATMNTRKTRAMTPEEMEMRALRMAERMRRELRRGLRQRMTSLRNPDTHQTKEME